MFSQQCLIKKQQLLSNALLKSYIDNKWKHIIKPSKKKISKYSQCPPSIRPCLLFLHAKRKIAGYIFREDPPYSFTSIIWLWMWLFLWLRHSSRQSSSLFHPGLRERFVFPYAEIVQRTASNCNIWWKGIVEVTSLQKNPPSCFQPPKGNFHCSSCIIKVDVKGILLRG